MDENNQPEAPENSGERKKTGPKKDQDKNAGNKEDLTPSEQKVQSLIMYMILGGLTMIFLINVRHFWAGDIRFNDRVASTLTTLGNGLLIAGACFGAGALVGFLFGIPRLLENKNGESRGRLSQNDNLVQISDWLTKIIVGVGLTQISEFWPGLQQLGKTFSITFGGEQQGVNLAIATILYFMVTGFLSGYLWTRIHFYRLLAQTGNDVQRLEKELDETRQEKDQMEEQKRAAEAAKQAAEEEARHIQEMKKATEMLFEQAKREAHVLESMYSEENGHMKNEKAFISADTVSFRNDDPHAGQFGGKAEAKGRRLEAEVSETTFDRKRFNIRLRVVSTDETRPLEKEVIFYLHPTFRSPKRTIPVQNGEARLELIAWGSFTVGVECDGGQTKLELDLSKLPGVPALFAES